jgi:signal transduction histidine kinase
MVLHQIQFLWFKLKVFLCLVGCVLFTYTKATPLKEFLVKQLESERLPQSTVSQMLQDKSGYWWIITNGGLSRYDGSTVKNFTHKKLIQSNTQIVRICKNENGDVIAFDEQAIPYKILPNGLQPSTALKDSIWQPTLNNHLAVVSLTKHTSSIGMLRILKMSNNAIYVSGDNDGFYYKNGHRTTFNFPSESQYTYDFGGGLDIFEINNLLYKITNHHKLEIFDSTSNTKSCYFTGDVLQNPLFRKSYNPVNTKILYAQHVPYLLMGQNIYSLEADGESINTKILISDIPSTIRPLSLGIDTLNDAILLGTISNGVYYLQKKLFNVRLASSEKYLDNVFYGILPLKNNWFYSSKGFTFNLPGNVEYPVVTNIGSYQGIFADDNFIFLSFKGKIIKFQIDSTPKLKPVATINASMVQMERGPDKRIWFCTKDNIGILEGDSIIWKAQRLLSNNVNTYIQCFKFINNDEILVGTGGGLYKYKVSTQQMSNIPQLGKARVRDIIADTNNSYWICTYGQGLYYYSNEKYYHYNNPHLATPHTVLKDKNNNLWISTNNGLYKVNEKELINSILRKSTQPILYRYTRENGFLTNEFNGGCHPCGYAFSDSLFLLPSMNGLVYFNPLSIRDPYQQYPITIDNAVINSTPLQFVPRTVLPYDFQNADITISSPYYGSLGGMNMEYMIKGYDKNWQPLLPDRDIRLKGLPNGSYSLEIRKLSGNTKTRYVSTSIPFSVAAPFWKTPLCYLLLAILFVVLMYVIFKLSLINITNRKKKLEQEVANRTRQLEHSLDQLSASNQKLMDTTLFREQILSFVLHDIRSPLKYISRISESLYKNHQQMDAKQLHEYIGDLHESTVQFTSFSDGFLQWINTHSNKFYLNKKTFNLHYSTQSIFNIFNEIAKEKNIRLVNNIVPNFIVNTDETILGIIVRNIIDNAIKYTPSGSITIEAFLETPQVYIVVTDTGIGMREIELDRLRKNLAQRDKSTSGGLGMLIVSDMIQLLNGSLEIGSQHGVGTSVKVSFES